MPRRISASRGLLFLFAFCLDASWSGAPAQVAEVGSPGSHEAGLEPKPTSPEQLRELVRSRAEARGVPSALADALVQVTTDYKPGAVGPFGEIGLMYLRPSTARMLGFRGGLTELFGARMNVEYGTAHLARAWEVARGDLCRTLVKYTSHYAEEEETSTSADLCRRVEAYLTNQGAHVSRPAVAPISRVITTSAASIRERDSGTSGAGISAGRSFGALKPEAAQSSVEASSRKRPAVRALPGFLPARTASRVARPGFLAPAGTWKSAGRLARPIGSTQ